MAGLSNLRMLGCSAAGGAVDWALLAALASIAHVPIGVAAAAGALVGGLVNFALQRRIAFRMCKGTGWLPQLVRYLAMVVLGSAVWNGLLVHAAAAWLALPYPAGKAAASLLVVAGWNLPVTARLVFARS